MLEKVYQEIIRYGLINRGDKVLVALSGGPDSAALLHVLAMLSARLEIEISALHINHMLRGDEADGDQRYAGDICKMLGVSFFAVKYDVAGLAEKEGLSLEEAGRNARYEALYSRALKTGANKIAVAHNRNDQAETVLMNIMRGTGLNGLKGMDRMRDKIIRPMLSISRDEIEEYCKINGLTPRIDSTNLKCDFTRNKIRLELIPYINSEFKINFTEKLFNLSEMITKDNDFLEGEAQVAAKRLFSEIAPGTVEMSRHELSLLNPAIVSRVLRIAAGRVMGTTSGLEKVHLEDMEKLLHTGKTGTYLELPAKLRASVMYDKFSVYIDDGTSCGDNIKYEHSLIVPGETEVPEGKGLLKATVVDSSPETESEFKKLRPVSLTQVFDYDKLKKGMNIRNRQDGDVFRPFQSGGSKKLKDYFIDCKIPRGQRSNIPLVTSGNDVLWVVGYRKSDLYKPDSATKKILVLEWKNNSEGECF